MKVFLGSFFLLISSSLIAQISNTTRNYSERTDINIVGNYEVIGNTNMQCSGCAAGTLTNNPPANMVYVDIDGIAGNQNSSSSLLTIPAGATVEWAGLYWGGVYSSTFAGITNPTGMNNDQVQFMEPGATSYTTINATTRNLETTTFGGWNTFMSFAEVTPIVQAAGSGNYFVADINLATGSAFTGTHGGWVLVVVYSEATEQSRRINVWDGFRFFGFGATDSFNVTGVLTPSLGAFETKVAYYGMDGEASSAGDFISINGTALSDASNPANNVFNGTISVFGANNANRNPNITPYNWGYDLDVFNVSGLVPNSSTSVAVQLGSASEGVWGGVFVISNEIVLPSVSKSFSNTNVTRIGDISTVSITIDNPNRGISMTGASVIDNLPAGVVIAPTPNASISCGGAVTAVAGSSTFTASGMNIPVNTTCTITFDVVGTQLGVFANTIDNSVFSNNEGVDLQNSATAILQVGQDIDGDGIIDVLDLDDDNDGITDTQELCATNPLPSGSSSATITIAINLDQYENETSWELRDPSSTIIASGGPYAGTDEIVPVSPNFNVATPGDYTFNIFDSFGDGFSGPAGGSDSDGTAGYTISVDGTIVVSVLGYFNFGSGGTLNTHTFSVAVPPSNVFSCTASDPSNDDDGDGLFNYEDPDFCTLNANGVCANLDNDGDGIINSLDLDSDNDGIYDIIESGAIDVSGVNDSNTDGVIDGITVGSIGTNGVFNTVETTADSGILTYTVVNTDGIDTRDFLDLDSDNDSCNDVDEARFTDDNSDGLLGNSPLTVNANGVVTSGTDGYTTPANLNLNTTFDFQEVGPDANSNSIADGCERSDLELIKTVDNSSPSVGDTIIFTLTVTNEGPIPTNNIQILDILPTGLINIVVMPSSGTYNLGTGIWDLNTTLSFGQSANLVISVEISPACGTITNTAEVISSNELDFDSIPNNGQ